MNDENPQKQGKYRWLMWILSLAVVVALLGVVLAIRGQRLPRMDRATFEAAKARWDEQKPANYEISIAVSGRQPGTYFVGVEQGIATSAKLDGRALTRPRTFGTWSVDGMFATLQRDLDTQDAQGNLMLGAEFHEELGVPLQYERIEMQTGVHDSLRWEVTQFETP